MGWPVYNNQTSVDQQQGGSKYPFLSSNDNLPQLISDLVLVYADPLCAYALPLKISWLSGFGTEPADDPTERTRDYELLISDNIGRTVFDSMEYDTLSISDWGTDYKVLQWSKEDPVPTDDFQLLRVILCTAPTDSATDEALVWPVYFEPSDGRLDARVISRIPRLVQRISVVTAETDPNKDIKLPVNCNAVLRAGYNMLLEPVPSVAKDGEEQHATIRLSAVPAAGAGRVPCSPEVLLRRINDAQANSNGAVIIDASGCYRVERPIDELVIFSLQESLPEYGDDVALVANTLQLSNDCGPCCECDDFVAVYEALRRLTARFNRLGLRAEAIRDQYIANKEAWEDEVLFRRGRALRLVSHSLPYKHIAIGFGICNASELPIKDIALELCALHYRDDMLLEEAKVCPVPRTTYMLGNTIPGEVKGRKRTPYDLEQDGAKFSAYFDCIDPVSLGTVTTVLRFEKAQEDDEIRLELRAKGVDTVRAQPVCDQTILKDVEAVDVCCEGQSISSTCFDDESSSF